MSSVMPSVEAGIAVAIRPIEELDRAAVAFAGGKGANLGELARAGLQVPPAFVVGAPVYAAFVEETGLRARIAARLDELDVDDADAQYVSSDASRFPAAVTAFDARGVIVARHAVDATPLCKSSQPGCVGQIRR